MIDIKDIANAIKPFVLGWIKSYMNVGARVYNNATISHATSGAWQNMTFNSERYDTDGLHSTSVNTSRLTCTQAGKYLIGGNIQFAANATGYRGISVLLNGTTYIASDGRMAVTTAGLGTPLVIITAYDLIVGDYVELSAYQASGGALNIGYNPNFSPEFWMQRAS